MIWGKDFSWPLQNITFGHRSHAIYELFSLYPDHKMVNHMLHTKLHVQALHPKIPEDAIDFLRDYHNDVEGNMKKSLPEMFDLLDVILPKWDVKRDKEHWTYASMGHAKIQSLLWDFVSQEPYLCAFHLHAVRYICYTYTHVSFAAWYKLVYARMATSRSPCRRTRCSQPHALLHPICARHNHRVKAVGSPL